MAFVLKDRVKGWTNTTGEDNFVIFATQDGFQPFSVIGNGNETYYTIFDPNNYDWETGIGTFTASTQTLSRDTILSSSNNNAKVVFLLGTKEVFVGYPAEKAVTLDTAQTVSNKTLTSATITGSTINSTSVGATTPATGAFTTLVASGASITSINAGVALLTTATVTSLTATGASIASANIGNLQFTAASVASINAGVAVITNLTATSASIASANVGVAVIASGSVNNTTVGATTPNTGAFTTLSASSTTSLNPANANVSLAPTGTGTVTINPATAGTMNNVAIGGSTAAAGTFTALTATGASVASANLGVALITTGTVTNFTATGASVASANIGVALVTTGTVTNLTATGASIASANAGTAIVTNLQVTGASAASANFGLAVIAAGTAAAPKLTTTGDLDTGMYFPAANEAAITTGGTVAAAFNSNGLFFRNRIINGDMRIDQRNAGAAVTTDSSFPVDRWFLGNGSSAAVSFQQSTAVIPTGFTQSVGVTITTADASIGANDYLQYAQWIEGNNIADFGFGSAAARTITISFWVRGSVTGTYCIVIGNSNAGTGAPNRSYVAEYTISVANTWEYKTITISGDTSGTWNTSSLRGMVLRFGLTAGTNFQQAAGSWGTGNVIGSANQTQLASTLNATWFVTGVQLETGSVATPFERRPYTTELQLCQRYYEKSYGLSVALGTGLATGFSGMTTSSAATAEAPSGIIFKVSKRADPTITIYNAVSGTSGAVYRISDAASVNVSSINYVGQSQVGYLVLASGNQNSYYYHWTASIEL